MTSSPGILQHCLELWFIEEQTLGSTLVFQLLLCLTAKDYVFCGDEKGSVWMYNLSNYTTAWSSAKGKRSDKRIPPTQVGLAYPLGLSRASLSLLSRFTPEHAYCFLYLTLTSN